MLALLMVVAVGVTGCAVYASISSQLPDPDITKAKGRDQTTVVLDAQGRTITKFYAEQNRQDVALSTMPEALRQAVIATEDKRFYQHEGVDAVGLTRALVTDIVKREKAQGGSTITQQYVKNAFVTDERTLKRKVQEAVLAQKVEKQFTKDQILELYLNTIYFGHGAYGVEAASRAYFNKPVEQLTLPESAMIAGVIKSPGRYSPRIDPEAAKIRRDTVLTQMKDQGYLSQAQYAEAVASPVKPVVAAKTGSSVAPYFVEWIREQLVDQYGQQAVYRGGMKVRTTLDIEAQRAAEKAVSSTLNKKGDPSAAIVALDPKTGAVRAMVGGRDFKTQQFNVATQGKRQPGSAFKPFVLATALAQGVSPEMSFESGPAALKVGDQTWKVTGASGGSKGPMRLREATEKSVNSVYAQLILKVGADKVVETAEKLGVHKGIAPVPAIALGGLEDGVSPLEMASAYGTLAAGGLQTPPYGIARVEDAKGKVLFESKPTPKQAIDADVAFLTTDILSGVIKNGTGKPAAIGRPAAGKTGTTQEYRDAWFVGYTPDLVAAVWVGYPDAQREMKDVHGRAVTGGSFPAEIWAKFMKSALDGTDATAFPKPEGLKTVEVCAVSGGIPTAFCPKTVSALVLAKHLPGPCELHKTPTEVIVPSLVGSSKEEALAALQKLTLTASVVEKVVAGAVPGTVTEQSPKAGSKVKPGAKVTLTVASGAAANAAPVASFTGPTQGKTGVALAFDGSASTDDGSITTYFWEFGDGQTASGKTASHAWAAPGTYEVTLWVTDDRGEKASTTKSVKIK